LCLLLPWWQQNTNGRVFEAVLNKELLVLDFIFFNQILRIMAIEITDANFEELVLNSDKPVVVDFWAEWCGPCRMVGPIIDELHTEYEGKAVVGKVNVDQNQAIARKYGIRNIPTVLFFNGGEPVDKQVGAQQKDAYASKLEALMS
jgi:thioredoxin 1